MNRPGATVRRAVEYAVVPGFRPLLLDFHRGASPVPVPVVVFLHGGGWRVGSRSSFGPMFADWLPTPFERLVAAGFAVASVDYRLSGEAAFPAQLEDVSAAVRWLRGQAGELGVDAERIVLWGESAGGHLAALAGLREWGVVGVVDWYGPSDLTALSGDMAEAGLEPEPAPGSAETRETLLLGARIEEVPDKAAAASPAKRVHAGAPPFLLLHGNADRMVPYRQSERLAAALADAGAEVDFRLVEGADHLWRGNASSAIAAFETSLEFARDRCFGGRDD